MQNVNLTLVSHFTSLQIILEYKGQKLTAVVNYFLQRESAFCVKIMNVGVFVINRFCIANLKLSHCSPQKRKEG